MEGLLCMLAITSPLGSVITVTRSHDGSDWESREIALDDYFSSLKFACIDDACSVNLPLLKDNESYTMHECYHTLSYDNELARFLEQSTFSTASKALTEFYETSNTTDNVSEWLYNEMHAKETTLHRQ